MMYAIGLLLLGLVIWFVGKRQDEDLRYPDHAERKRVDAIDAMARKAEAQYQKRATKMGWTAPTAEDDRKWHEESKRRAMARAIVMTEAGLDLSDAHPGPTGTVINTKADRDAYEKARVAAEKAAIAKVIAEAEATAKAEATSLDEQLQRRLASAPGPR
ncbi:hypothetical protein [Reyranella sp. CPCC 100927]|uniref:hypothetical protein n=1 Tax=Reyranella sp. CPCC 100927 TaxID=2599616 RepID=UPI0011B56347|nr:hypothetical protein [Reyranella sp. CPCC 100927]TWS94985.1 hypothetical protein FQU96_40770 [Reyranella sp. CPCC 100927]